MNIVIFYQIRLTIKIRIDFTSGFKYYQTGLERCSILSINIESYVVEKERCTLTFAFAKISFSKRFPIFEHEIGWSNYLQRLI